MSKCMFTNEDYCAHDACWKLWLKEEHLLECQSELARIRYFMSVRIDFDGKHTVLDYYEGLDKEAIDRMMNDTL